VTPLTAAARLPREVVVPVSMVPFAVAVLVIAVGLVRVATSGRLAPAEFAAALALGLEFFLAAGLLRLAAVDTFAALGVVALVIVVRRVIGAGVRASVRALLGMAPRIRA
jgi:uncharacterized membrane protein